MKHILLIPFIVFVSNVFASESWLLGSQELLLGLHPSGALMNQSCSVKSDCQAFKALSEPKALTTISSGGKNPASEVCQNLWKGRVLIASRAGATQGFCQFTDGSFASLSGMVK